MPRLLTVLLACAFLVPTAAAGDNWPQWRGPHQNGVADGDSFPVEWDREKNVKWRIELPGPGGSTPIVWGDRIFLTLNADAQNQLHCYSMDGELLWTQSVGEEFPGKHKKATGANPSACTDGERVYCYFKSGSLAAFTMDGEKLWDANPHDLFGEVNHETLWWDLGTSPVLTKNALVVTCMQSGPSYLAAFDKKTGDILWKEDRKLPAPREAAQSYATPIVLEHEGREIIVVLGADHVTAHDANNGKEIWRVGGLNPDQEEYFRSISSAVITDGMVIAPYARGATLTGIRLGGTGDVTRSHVAWTLKGPSADVPTPVAVDGRVFVLRDGKRQRGTVDCLDARSGRTIWSGQVEGARQTFSSSPVLAGGRLYLTSEDGTVFVVDATGSDFRQVATNSIGNEMTVATPVPVDGKLLLRTHEALYLIGS